MSGSLGFQQLPAPAAWKAIDFISDLHLARNTPCTLDAWASYLLRTPADAVFILGDLFEVWVGDDARHDGFEAHCAAVLTNAARLRHVAFMPGNRDFLVGSALLEQCGVMPLNDPTLLLAFEQRLLLTHGDLLCLSDTEYQQFRAEVRAPQWRTDFLSKPLETRRLIARQMRDASEQNRRQSASSHPWGDIDSATAATWLNQAKASTLIHGHTHRPCSEEILPGLRRYVLTDWDLDHSSARSGVLRLTRTGLTLQSP